MNLNDAQKQTVSAWIADGLKLSEIQKRLETEFGLRVTYMEVRFLLDDLKIIPKDPPPPVEAPKAPAPGTPSAPAPAAPPVGELPVDEVLPGSGVRVTVDRIAQPGAMVSGTVSFSDGQSGTWYLDQTGRLGLGMKQKGYRPSQTDVEDFQMQLQQELAKQGF